MSTSQDNLPVVTEETKQASVADMVQALPRKIFTREAALWVVAILLGGVAFAQGMERLDGGMEKQVAPLTRRQDVTDAEVARLKADVAQVKQQVANVERLGLETNLNVRLMLESRGIKPIDVPSDATDGGR